MSRWEQEGIRPAVRLVTGFLAVLLSACSNEGPTVFQRLGALAASKVAGPEEVTGRALTRADLDRIQAATIAVSSGAGPRAYLVPLARSGDYLDYRDEQGNSVVMLGGAISELETAGHDLDAVRFDPRDPIAHLTPFGAWPTDLWREYRFSVRQISTYGLAMHCVFEPQGLETIEIVELRYDLLRVREICTNSARRVNNTYWLEPGSGFIWKSEQWLGPNIGPVTIEIIRPFAG